jgi:leukotriene A-4 hydrolase/aminopeptidase
MSAITFDPDVFQTSSNIGGVDEVDHSTLSSSATTPVNYGKYDLKIDFEKKKIYGTVEYRVIVTPSTETTELVLDSNHLEISSVTYYVKSNKPEWSTSNDPGSACTWTLDAVNGSLGSALRVELPPFSQEKIDQGLALWVKVVYSTTSKSGALQWLPPEQTAGKQYPFCFTQCQAIHARSLIPCQDTPRIKIPYSARVRVVEPFTVLMSASGNFEQEPSMIPGLGPNDPAERGYLFEQSQPIPSYLLAIACGDLAFRPTSDYTGVFAEPSVVDAAAFEFSETESMVAAGSTITGCDYKETWGRYDVLCMPPSFPYGGMENPCLTFVTPTLLAGDKSLATVVIHEISHSWTGNLISNQTWRHFWLNEGWTMFLQRKIIRHLYNSKAEADLDAVVGLTALKQSVDGYGNDHDFTRLLPNLSGGIDPDDAFSSIPYEKGCSLLFHLERTCGGHDAFMNFFQSYVRTFGEKRHVNSHQFRLFYEKHFSNIPECQQVDWNLWLLGTGMPPAHPEDQFDRSLVNAAMNLKKAWVEKDQEYINKTGQLKDWKTGQLLVFLNALLQDEKSEATETNTLRNMNDMYQFINSENAEIRFRWQKLCIRAEMEEIIPHVVSFLKQQGRMKFTRPLYKLLYKSTMGKSTAIQTFVENKDIYHPICAKMVARDLELNE